MNWALRDYQQTEIKASSSCTTTSFFGGYRMNSTGENYHQLGTLWLYNSKKPACSVWHCCAAADSQPQPVSPTETRTLLLSMDHKTGEFTPLLSGGQGKQNLQSWNQSQAGMDAFRGENKRPSTCTGTAQNASCNLKVAQAQTVCRVLI